jgi:hypothetical protein
MMGLNMGGCILRGKLHADRGCPAGVQIWMAGLPKSLSTPRTGRDKATRLTKVLSAFRMEITRSHLLIRDAIQNAPAQPTVACDPRTAGRVPATAPALESLKQQCASKSTSTVAKSSCLRPSHLTTLWTRVAAGTSSRSLISHQRSSSPLSLKYRTRASRTTDENLARDSATMAANTPLPSRVSHVQVYVGRSLQHIRLPAAVLNIAAVKRNCKRMLDAVNELGHR